MTKKKSNKVVPQKPKNQSARLLVDPALTGGYRRMRRRTTLDDEFDAEDEMQARELRDLRMEKLKTKRKAEIAKLKRDIEKVPEKNEPGEKPKIPGISINVARQIAGLPEGERTRVLETYMLMQAAEAKQANSVLPAIVGFARANPGSSQNEMVEYAKLANEQLKTGIELAKGNEPKSLQDSSGKVLELMVDLIKESVRQPLEELSKSMVPQPSPFEAILMNDALYQRAKEVGMFGGSRGGAGTSAMDLKIEQLRTERDLEIKKIDLEWKKSMLERENQDKRTDGILTALAPLSAIFAGPVTQRMRQFGQQQAAAHNPSAPPGAIPPSTNTILIKCSCGYAGPMTFPGPPPTTVNCPKCDQMLVVGGAPSDGEPQETD